MKEMFSVFVVVAAAVYILITLFTGGKNKR